MERTVSEREEAAFAFLEGAEQAFQAFHQIYNMTDNELHMLFNTKNRYMIFHMEASKVFDILNRRDEIIANYIEPGDIIAKLNNEGWEDVVTFVYPDGTFDAVGYSADRWGQTTTKVTMKDYHKTGTHIDKFPFDLYKTRYTF